MLKQYLLLCFVCFLIYPDGVYSKKERRLRFKKLALQPPYLPLNLTNEQMQKFKVWVHGVIPYFIDDYSFDKVLRDKIRMFLELTSSLSGLQFVELPHPPEAVESGDRWVFFINRRGQLDCADCSPANFTDKGVQRVLIGYDCLGDGELASTILALVGVPPQHNAPNRDMYITILEENIIPDKKHFFSILPADDWLFTTVEYDFASASHYDIFKYTSNGQSTIKPVNKDDFPVGQSMEYSELDILKIEMLYQNTLQMKPPVIKHCSKLYKQNKPKSNKDDTEDAVPNSARAKNDNDFNNLRSPTQDMSKDTLLLSKESHSIVNSSVSKDEFSQKNRDALIL